MCSLWGGVGESVNKSNSFQEQTMPFSVTWSTAGNPVSSHFNSVLETHANFSSSHVYNAGISDTWGILFFFLVLENIPYNGHTKQQAFIYIF